MVADLVFGALAVTFVVSACRSPSRSCWCSGRASSPCRPRSGAGPRAPPVRGDGRSLGRRRCCSGSCCGASPVHDRRATGSSTSPVSRSSSPSTTCRSTRANEFPDGGLHPGYAFPLWHGFLALVAKVSGADPVDVVLHGPTVLAPIAVVLAFEAGWALFRRVTVPARASAAGRRRRSSRWLPAHGGALTALALPATGSRQLLVPAALALAIEATRRPTPVAARVRGGGVVRDRRRPPDVRALPLDPVRGVPAVRGCGCDVTHAPDALALAALSLPAALFFAWLLPVIGDTASVEPGRGRARACLRAVRGPARRDARQLRRRPGALRTDRRGRGRRRCSSPLAAPRCSAALGGVRRRRVARRLRDLPRPVALHAVRRRRLALAGAAARGLPPPGVRARGRDRRARPADRARGRAGRPRGRRGAAAALSRRLRLHPRDRRPGVGDVVRRRRLRRRPVRRAPRPAAARAARGACLGAPAGSDVRPRARELEPLARATAEHPLRGPDRGRPGARPDGSGRVRRPAGELSARCVRAGARLPQSDQPRRGHGRQPAS